MCLDRIQSGKARDDEIMCGDGLKKRTYLERLNVADPEDGGNVGSRVGRLGKERVRKGKDGRMGREGAGRRKGSKVLIF